MTTTTTTKAAAAIIIIIIQFNSLLFTYVPSQQLQGQLQTQHSVDTGKLH
jgi:hypothetical protein